MFLLDYVLIGVLIRTVNIKEHAPEQCLAHTVTSVCLSPFQVNDSKVMHYNSFLFLSVRLISVYIILTVLSKEYRRHIYESQYFI